MKVSATCFIMHTPCQTCHARQYYCYLIARFLFIGQQNDARMNIAIALTAVRHGASVANHMEVLSLLKKKGKW